MGAVLWLLGVNVLAHFLPFERAALAPDDFAILASVRGLPLGELVARALRNPDRPLNWLVLFLQERLTGLNAVLGLWLVFVSSSVLVLSVYGLLRVLLRDRGLAILGATGYLLLPNKLELFHTPIAVNMNLAFALYVWSFIGFIRFCEQGRRGWLVGSLLAYLLAIAWYEVGFFLPAVCWVYAALRDRPKRTAVWWYAVPAGLYLAFRLTGAFGLYDEANGIRQISGLGRIAHNIFVMTPNHYVGRYMARAMLYGLYRFSTLEAPWLLVLAVADVAVLWVGLRWLRSRELPALPGRDGWLAAAILGLLLVPNMLFIVEGRHTALASIGFILGLLLLRGTLRRYAAGVTAAVLALWLVVSQGTAWNQVVACRINRALLDTLQEHREDLRRADRVLIDMRSFADAIPYTWGERQGNMLDSYYGAQAFAPWGLTSMVRLTTDTATPVYIARSRPQAVDAQLHFEVQVDGPRQRPEVIPVQGTLIIDYEQVYGGAFRDGNRASAHRQAGEPAG